MTNETQQARRAAFELAMREKLLGEGYCLLTVPEVMARGSDGRYSSVRIRGAWEGFNAALDSIVIDLKSPYMDYSYRDSEITGACKQYDRCKAAIKQNGLGIKIK